MLNLTPHAITLRTPQGDVTFPPSGTVARVATTETTVGLAAVGPGQYAVPVIATQSAGITGLPADTASLPEGCLVSSMVLDALPPGTRGVFAPDTGATAVRNEAGHVIAVTRLRTVRPVEM